jgi:hypothetical protein
MRSESRWVGLVVGGWLLWGSVASAEELPAAPPRPEGAIDVAIREGDVIGDRVDGDDEEDAAAPPPPAFDPNDEPPKRAGDYRHDGGFLRFAFGPLLATAAVNDLGPARVDGRLFGVGTLTEFSGGGSPFPGLVLAARLGIGVVIDPGFGPEATPGSSQVLDTMVLPTIGPLVDVYPMPDMGLHFFFNPSLTVAHLGRGETVSDGGGDIDAAMVGYSLAGGVGYEAWLSEQWSFSALLRIDGGRLAESQGPESEDASMTLWTPTVQVGFTYH